MVQADSDAGLDSAAAVPTRRSGTGQPTAPDLAEQIVRERVRASLFDDAIARLRVNQFTVLWQLGAGGMGTVYAAYDDRLERKVAIKFLAAGLDDHDLLLSEARAMARLSHPNVVAVHEVGEHDGQIFIAMEFVAGRTLRDVCRARAQREADAPRWQEVLALFIQAGRGLAAAHAANFIHRDFKPDNVLVGDDGRVRVVDFGLAREVVAAEPGQSSQSPAPASDTSTVKLAGTIAYMAPEQFAGAAATPRSDQYSFCASLWEALYGRRVFTAASTEQLIAAVRAGQLPPQPAGFDIPPRVHALLVRGLAREPTDRWPDMDALLAALAHDPAISRRRTFLIAGVLALVGASVGLTRALAGEAPGLCSGAEARLQGVWDPPRRAAVATALQRPDLSYAADTAAHVEGIFDDYAARLVATHVATCEATRVRGERSEAMLDLSMTCLDRRTAELAALVDEFTRADDGVRERAVAAARHLSDPSGCADVGRLALPVAPPAEPDRRAAVRELEHGLDVLTAQRLAGRYREALALIGALVDRARAVDHLPTLAEALALQATLLADTGDVDAAIAVGHEATYAAEAGHHDEVLARVRTRLLHWLGYAATREVEALAMAR